MLTRIQVGRAGGGGAKDTEKVIRREKSLKMSGGDGDLSTNGQYVTYVFGYKWMVTVSGMSSVIACLFSENWKGEVIC